MTSFKLLVIRFMALVCYSIVFKEDRTIEPQLRKLMRDCNRMLNEGKNEN